MCVLALFTPTCNVRMFMRSLPVRLYVKRRTGVVASADFAAILATASDIVFSSSQSPLVPGHTHTDIFPSSSASHTHFACELKTRTHLALTHKVLTTIIDKVCMLHTRNGTSMNIGMMRLREFPSSPTQITHNMCGYNA